MYVKKIFWQTQSFTHNLARVTYLLLSETIKYSQAEADDVERVKSS